MKRLVLFSVVFCLAVGLALAGNGNNLPPGPRFVLNVIAFDQCPAGDFIGSNRHMIAVQADWDDGLTGGRNAKPDPFYRNNDILLAQAASFDDIQVLDGNACDAEGAQLALPINPFSCPEPTPDQSCVDDPSCPTECLGEDLTFQAYNIYVRLVGRPGTGVDVRTCGEAIDPDTLDEVVICSMENMAIVRVTGKGSMKFVDYTRELTTVLADVDLDGDLDRVGLFDPALEDYFWNWNTDGKAHAQLVFIPIPD